MHSSKRQSMECLHRRNSAHVTAAAAVVGHDHSEGTGRPNELHFLDSLIVPDATVKGLSIRSVPAYCGKTDETVSVPRSSTAAATIARTL